MSRRIGSLVVVGGILIAGLCLSGCADAAAPGVAAPTLAEPTIPSYALNPSQSQLINEARAACMTDRGWQVRIVPGAGYTNVNPLSDAETKSFQVDSDACAAENGAASESLDVTDEVLVEAWERENEAWQCLFDAGFEVAEVPSQKVYVENFRAGDQYSTWHSLITEVTQSAADLDRLGRLCPDPMQWFGEG
ncbi:hypothetical protein IF188_15205 [Microbacterium sp. NEAU-LLC]|uniref:Uncharacterized protein n=1 Tax=Microbacterium helvum TaxID=2773713 RepID=A0ABR8NTH1_9MICO|nr:hypothetical protein [Microbacterium helvum]MBD3943042.1 hypothetical protein [Microbacterium helvum]